jgi:hypothetical protein
MKGFWLSADDDGPGSKKRPAGRHIAGILSALKAKGKEGLSNAEIDSLLGTASQWLIFWEMRELVAQGIVRYDVHLFGEPSKYILTDKGLALVE